MMMLTQSTRRIVLVGFNHPNLFFLTRTHFSEFALALINTKVMLLFNNPKRHILFEGENEKNNTFSFRIRPKKAAMSDGNEKIGM